MEPSNIIRPFSASRVESPLMTIFNSLNRFLDFGVREYFKEQSFVVICHI